MLWWTLAKLKSSDPKKRAAAARELGEQAGRRAVPRLIETLSDKEAAVRRAAADALSEIVHPAATEPLVNALAAMARSEKASHDELRALAVAVAKQGKPAVGPLLRLLTAAEKNARLWAAHSLGRIGDPEALAALSKALDDRRSDVRREAALALGSLRTAAAAEPLVRALAHRDIETRRAAAEALGGAGGVRAVEALGRAVQDPDEALQLAAIAALGRIGGVAAALRLRPALDAEKKAVREAATSVLHRMETAASTASERAAVAVLRLDVDAAVREGDAAIEPLIEALRSRNPARRLAGVRGLAVLRPARAIPDLLRALKDREATVQAAAADAVASFGPEVLEGLQEILESGDASSQGYAALALGRIGDARAVPALVEAYTQNRRASGSWIAPLETARAAAEALVSILERHGPAVSDEDLERIAGLRDAVLEIPAIAPGQTYREEVRVDVENLRGWADKERERRDR